MSTRILVSALLLCTLMEVDATAQTPSPNISASEMSACRGDAIRLCFFSIAQTDALRACLRRNKPDLSTSCRKLIEARGN